MKEPVSRSDADVGNPKLRIRLITHATWLLTIPVFLGIGALVRQVLLWRGKVLPPLEEIMPLFLVFAAFHAIPVLVCTHLIRSACFKAISGNETRFSAYILRVVNPSIGDSDGIHLSKLIYAVSGSCICTFVLMSYFLFSAITSDMRVSFAEAVIMTVAMFPLTLGLYFLLSLVAVGVGGAIGGRIYELKHESRS